MFIVFWLQIDENNQKKSEFKEFDINCLNEVLIYMEKLRLRNDVQHVVLSSNNINSVGLPGVDSVKPGYNWTKRRYNGNIRKNKLL
jgi:hypothetical protein